LDFSSGTATVAISNSNLSASGNSGLVVAGSSASISVSIDNVSFVDNFVGISVSGFTKVLLGRSVVTGNTTGIQNQTLPNTFYTYKDNRINGNTTDICTSAGCGPLNTTFALQ
jgi:hypothetical protein